MIPVTGSAVHGECQGQKIAPPKINCSLQHSLLWVFITKSKTLQKWNDLVKRSGEQPCSNGKPTGIQQCCGKKDDLFTTNHQPGPPWVTSPWPQEKLGTVCKWPVGMTAYPQSSTQPSDRTRTLVTESGTCTWGVKLGFKFFLFLVSYVSVQSSMQKTDLILSNTYDTRMYESLSYMCMRPSVTIVLHKLVYPSFSYLRMRSSAKEWSFELFFIFVYYRVKKIRDWGSVKLGLTKETGPPWWRSIHRWYKRCKTDNDNPETVHYRNNCTV